MQRLVDLIELLIKHKNIHILHMTLTDYETGRCLSLNQDEKRGVADNKQYLLMINLPSPSSFI